MIGYEENIQFTVHDITNYYKENLEMACQIAYYNFLNFYGQNIAKIIFHDHESGRKDGNFETYSVVTTFSSVRVNLYVFQVHQPLCFRLIDVLMHCANCDTLQLYCGLSIRY